MSNECINAIVALKTTLRNKESKFAGYQRRNIRNSLDAMTTSPVEGNNRVIKHGPFKVTSNMNLDKSTRRIVQGINSRIRLRNEAAAKEVSLNDTIGH